MQTPRTEELGQFIQRHRLAKGTSIRALARALDINAATVMRIETGESTPSPKQLQRVARTIEVDIKDLYALAGYFMPEGLPDFAPYLRSKYDLPDSAVDALDEYFQHVAEKHQSQSDKK